MIFSENLDHKPESVTLERLPNGTAWLYLRKDVREVAGDPMADGEPSGGSFECATALCKLGKDYIEETESSVEKNFNDWWTFAESWDSESEKPPTIEERVALLETIFLGGLI